MDIGTILENDRDAILDQAAGSLQQAHSVHYAHEGEQFTHDRLVDLFDLVVDTIGKRDLSLITGYAEQVARERFSAGFDIAEVQDGFNALESAMWRHVVAAVPPQELAQDVGLLSTVLGAGKDMLARTYVSLASDRHVPSLDLTALFEGAAGS